MHDADALVDDGDDLLQGRRDNWDLGLRVAGSWTGNVRPTKDTHKPSHSYVFTDEP